jgi:hypothetical protein
MPVCPRCPQDRRGDTLGEDGAQQSLSQALADVSELTDDKVALEESLVTVKGEAGACYAAASLGSEALENRKEALDIIQAVPWNASNAEWDAAYDKTDALDNEFERLAGRVEVADAACIAANEAANQSVGAVEFLG